MTQKSLPPFSAPPPSYSPHPHVPLTPSEGDVLKEWENDSPWTGLRCCVVLPLTPSWAPHPLNQGRGWGGGDSPLLFRTLAEILPAES